ncbi:MAG: TonB-dependent receptor [Bryobacteraceae bacterium]
MIRRLACLAFLAYASVIAQTNKATITGLVKDSSGAAIPGVKVVATNISTNLTSETQAGASGAYSIPALNPGEYKIEAESAGFKKAVLSDVILQVNQQARIDLVLEVGQVSESVDVHATTPAIETESPNIGGVISQSRIENLPLNGRNFMELTTLTAGITEGVSSNAKNVLSKGFAPSAAGMPATENSYQLDGIDNKEPVYHSFNIAPSVDAIGEFKIQVGQYSAEFGSGGGAVINVVTKSGTNELHGTLFEFLRNDKLDARNFFSAKKPPLRLNQFGAYAGGPVIKNRTFVFGGYEGSRERRGITLTQTVPTADQRTGNLASFNKVIRDPLNGNTPFPGGLIPANRLDPISQNILKYYAFPNGGIGASNYAVSPSRLVDQNNWLVRADHRLTDNNDLMGRYARQSFDRYTPGAFPEAGGLSVPQTFENTGIGLTTRVTPTLISEFRFGFSRLISTSVGQNFYKPVMKELGLNFQGQASADQLYGYPESIVLSNTSISTYSEGLPRIQKSEVYQFTEGVTWAHNNHTFKFGADIRRSRAHELLANYVRRSYTFSGQYSGDGFADFLLGYPSALNVGLDLSPQFDYGDWKMGFYGADDWKVSSKLTLNLGLRYEFVTPAREDGGFTPMFDMTLGGLRFPKQNTAAKDFYTRLRPDLPWGYLDRETLFKPDKNNLAPRFGFAYKPFGNTNTVVRGGYGWFYSQTVGLNIANNAFSSPPGSQLVSLSGNTTTPDLRYSGKTGLSPADYFRSLTYGVITGSESTLLNGYTQQYSLSVGHEFGKSFTLETQYLGSKGTHIETFRDFNSTNNPKPGALASNVPFPQWGRLLGFVSGATSNYNALLVTAEKRFGEGLAFKGSYTYAKALGGAGGRQTGGANGNPQNPQNMSLENGRTSDDMRHRLSVNYVYELPFGPGKHFAGNTHALPGKLIGGWKVTGVTSVRSGLPLNPGVNNANCNSAFQQTCRADLIGANFGFLGGSGVDSPRWSRAAFDYPLNTALHPAQPPRFGTAGTNILDGNILNNWDVSIMKDTKIAERKSLEFRFEMFNVWNHASFGNPNASVDNAQFGRTTSTLTDPRDIQIALKFYF